MDELYKQQQSSTHLCDVILRVEDEEIPAHSCVLAACSDYFKTLLTGDFDDCRAKDYNIPNAPHLAVAKVVAFMYRGVITVSIEDVEDILALADYFCMEKLKEYCTTFLKKNVTEENCLYMKMIADKYTLTGLVQETTHFISPRFSELLHAPEALELPAEFLAELFKDEKYNYIREQEIFEFIIRWISHNHTEREKHFSRLFNCIELCYLSRTFLTKSLSEETIISEGLGDDLIKVIRDNLIETERRSVEEVVVCRSRSVNIGEEVKLLCYVIHDDQWVVVKNPEPHIFDGLESMLKHMGCLYFLVSKTEDMYGYMHHTEEKKYFWRCDLKTGVWEHLPPPKKVRGSSRLVSHVNGIYVIDKVGMVEEYNWDNNDWLILCEKALFDFPSATWYVLPMSVDRYIYILRAYSAGYSFSYAQLSFQLIKLDTVQKTSEVVSDIEAGDVDLEEFERIHGYVARPGKLTLKNELGESRLRFHFSDRTWSTRKPRILLPKFVDEVWGSVEWMDRVYFAGKKKQDNPVFMLYDYGRSRFKTTEAPSTYISGMMCQVRIPKTTLQQLIVQPDE